MAAQPGVWNSNPYKMAGMLGTDVAKLVLGYLQQQQLHDVGIAFCEKSPHLKEEWEYLSQGFEMFPMTEQTTLLDKLCEHNMIRMRVSQFVDRIPVKHEHPLFLERSTLRRIEMILSSADPAKVRQADKRRFSIDYDQSPSATQSKDLPGFQYESAAKRQRLFTETTPSVQKSVPKCTLSSIKKPISPLALDAINYSNSSGSTTTKSLAPTSSTTHPINQSTSEPLVDVNILSTTILENTAFQNVLLNSLNNILQTPSKDAPPIENPTGTDTGFQFDINSMNMLLNSLERDPTYEELVEDCVHAVEMNKSGRSNQPPDPTAATTSTPQKSDSEHSSCSSIPIKRRLRKRKPPVEPLSIDVPDSPPQQQRQSRRKSTSSKRAIDVQVISNEASDMGNQLLLQQIHNQHQQSAFVNPNKLIIVNADGSLAMTDDPQSAFIINYVTVTDSVTGAPSILVSNAQPMSGCSVLPADPAGQGNTESEQIVGFQEATFEAPVMVDTVPENPEPEPCTSNQIPHTDDQYPAFAEHIIEAPIAKTPKQLGTLNQSKAKSLSTPRRHSHVRVLNFCTPAALEPDGSINASNRSQKLLSADPHASNMTPVYGIVNQTIPASAPPKLHHRTPENALSDNDDIVGQNELLCDDDLFGRDLNEATMVAVDSTKDLQPQEPASSTGQEPPLNTPHIPKTQSKKPIIRKADLIKPIADTQPATKPKPRTRKPKNNAPPELVDKVDEPPPSSFGSDLDQWNKMRAVKPDEWDNHLREEFSRCGIVGSSGRRITTSRRKRKQTPKRNKSLNSSTDLATADVSMTEENGNELATSPASPAKNEDDQRPATEAVANTPLRSNKIHIKLATPSKSGRKTKTSTCNIKYKEPKISPKPRSTTKKRGTNKEDPKENHSKESVSSESVGSKNLSSLLETPFKENLDVPPTPRVLLSSITHETPAAKLPRRCNTAELSVLKNPEFPTPQFPITPGGGTTPPPTHPSSSNSRVNELLASDSPYYRPDESEDLIPPSVRSRPTPSYENASPAYERASPAKPQTNQTSSTNSTHNSSSTSSNSSSSNNSTSSNTTSDAESDAEEEEEAEEQVKKETNTQPSQPTPTPASAQKQNQMRILAQKQQAQSLEEVRQRTMAKIKEGNSQEHFKTQAPLTQRRGKLALRQGFSAAVAASKQKPTIAPGKSRTTPKQIAATERRPVVKRKAPTPRKVICLKAAIPTGRSNAKEKPNCRKPKTVSQPEPKDVSEVPFKSLTTTSDSRPICPASIEVSPPPSQGEHSSKTQNPGTNSKNPFVHLRDLFGIAVKTAVTSPDMKIPETTPASCQPPFPPEPSSYTSNAAATTNAIYSERLRDLFGDPSMSDSDFMDTPVKVNAVPEPSTSKSESLDTTLEPKPKHQSPAHAITDTPRKSFPIKLPAKKRRDATTDITHQTSNSNDVILPPETEIPPPITTTPQPPVTETSSQPIADTHDDSASDCDPFDECSFALSTNPTPHCGIFHVTSDSNTLPDAKESAPLACPPFNLVIDGERIRLSTTAEIVLFEQNSIQGRPNIKELLAESAPKTPTSNAHPSRLALAAKPGQSDEFGSPLLSSTPMLKKPIPKTKITYKPETTRPNFDNIDCNPSEDRKRSSAADSSLNIRNLDINMVLGKIHPAKTPSVHP